MCATSSRSTFAQGLCPAPLDLQRAAHLLLPLAPRFFTDAYDLYSVGIITPMIAYARFPEYLKGGKYGSLPTNDDLVVKGIALVGTLLGQIVFGIIGDKLGR